LNIMNSKRVVITGLGAVTPLGNSVPELWDGLKGGRSGVSPLSLFDASHLKTRIAAEVRNFQIPAQIKPKKAQRLDRSALFALTAALEAWQDANINNSQFDTLETGVIIGSSHGGETTALYEMKRLLESDQARVSPLLIPKILNNMASAQVAMLLGLQGPNFAVSSACATGSHAIGEAAELIKRGDAQIMLCGGTDACLTPLTFYGDEASGCLSTCNNAPAEASRPFDAQRDGFVLAEGAGVVLLEDLEHALMRHAHIYCELRGYAATSDASHETRPIADGTSAARAITRALLKAKLSPNNIDAIYAHATGTIAGDKAEVQALKLSLGDSVSYIPITAIKSMLGHMLGAAGAVQAIAAAKSLQEQIIPPTINYSVPDPDFNLTGLSQQARHVNLRNILSNSFGFGGHNACLILSSFE
jgi:3-oxoacyl-[acyl-carrier-protein] synthase II